MSAYSRELPVTLGEALQASVDLLSRRFDLMSQGLVAGEAEQIVSFSLAEEWGRVPSRAELLTSLGKAMPTSAAEKVIRVSQARAEGRILQHLTGFQTFLEHQYAVSPDVLVPRPETEVLVDRLVLEVKNLPQPPDRGLEIGLGSGVISIELASRFPFLKMTATELSSSAVFVAEENAQKILGESWRERLQIVQVQEALTVLPELSERFDFIISNPPYLVGPHETTEEVTRYEPAIALFAPKDDALFFYRGIAEGAKKLLTPKGIIAVEIPHERSQAILALFEAAGWKSRIELDLTGRERVLIAKPN